MPSTGDINVNLLRDLVHKYRARQNLSLRGAAQRSGVSFPTLQRVEAGQLPSFAVLVKLTNWLGIALDDLRAGVQAQHRDTTQQIEVLLRADQHLDEHAASAIAEIVRQVYGEFSRKRQTQ